VTAPTPTWPGLAEALAGVRRRIERSAVGDPDGIRLVAVTKGFPPAAAVAALALGLTDLGENYADELVGKAAALGSGEGGGPGPAAPDVPRPPDAPQPPGSGGVRAGAAPPRWHYLGAVQRNKVPRLAPVVACWQGLHRLVEGEAVARRAPGATVLVQVDVAGLPGRGGCPPEEVPGLVAGLRSLDLDVAGLMAVGPPGDPEAARPGFRAVRDLADRLDLRERSMGMTADLEVAVAEGSTMVRIGRALFGERPPRVHPPGPGRTTLGAGGDGWLPRS
jgi:uncharacterized pyridoxal phosphate-containing UPF0001 family protein